jgi:hypothetical protein
VVKSLEGVRMGAIGDEELLVCKAGWRDFNVLRRDSFRHSANLPHGDISRISISSIAQPL